VGAGGGPGAGCAGRYSGAGGGGRAGRAVPGARGERRRAGGAAGAPARGGQAPASAAASTVLCGRPQGVRQASTVRPRASGSVPGAGQPQNFAVGALPVTGRGVRATCTARAPGARRALVGPDGGRRPAGPGKCVRLQGGAGGVGVHGAGPAAAARCAAEQEGRGCAAGGARELRRGAAGRAAAAGAARARPGRRCATLRATPIACQSSARACSTVAPPPPSHRRHGSHVGVQHL